MRILTSGQMRRAENSAVEKGVTLAALMDAAGKAVARTVLVENAVEKQKIAVVCGSGNNGGDGFVAAALLADRGAAVTVVLAQGAPRTELAGNAFALLQGCTVIDAAQQPQQAMDCIAGAQILVDGIFGFGFHGSAQGLCAQLILVINASPGRVYAIDLPSGVQCDTACVEGPCVQADVTVTFTACKPACVSYPAKRYCGRVEVARIGVEEQNVQIPPHEQQYDLYTLQQAESALPRRDEEANKGTFGRLLCVTASYGMAGAGILAARAALRSGAGLVQLAVPQEIYPILAAAVPEAVFLILHTENGTLCEESVCALQQALQQADACVVGCGLGQSALARQLTGLAMRHSAGVLVADADALNWIARDPALLQEKKKVIFTPHPGEMARLVRCDVQQVQQNRLQTAIAYAKANDITLVLKGAASIIAEKDRLMVNSTGNPGMARGGSGDVLAGIIGSLCAQGMPAYEAACLGVFVHGMAGDLCAQRLSRQAMLPGDLIETLPQVFLRLESKTEQRGSFS